MGFSYRMGFTTVRNIVQEVCEAVWKNLAPIVMPQPTKDQWKEITKDFERNWQFPNCLGALDGKHVNIVCPINAGSTFYNYKQDHSIVLLALVDAQYKFIMIDVGAYGRNSDGGIYENSLMGQMFEQRRLNVPQNEPIYQHTEPMPYVIVADAAFPLKTYLLKPYSKAKLVNNDSNKVFNYRLSRARRTVENAFGILRARFRVFQGPMQVQPDMADKIVQAACSLHNYLRIENSQEFDENFENPDAHNGSPSSMSDIATVGRNFCKDAIAIREQFKEYFVSPDGQVPWQMAAIRQGRAE